MEELRYVLTTYPDPYLPQRVEQLGSHGGFSGSRLWRITAPAGSFCLRRWPAEQRDRQRLAYIHTVLKHVAGQGFDLLPVPVATRQQETIVRQSHHFWELTPWLPGQADYRHRPSRQKLVAALQTLARFHQAAASFADTHRAPNRGGSPGIMRRCALIAQLQQSGLAQLSAVVTPGGWPELAQRAGRLLLLFSAAAPAVASALETACRWQVPLQPCICDIWHDHVLFLDQAVSGLVDFGALRHDTVACDIARLLGSLAGDQADCWQWGLEAYQSIRPLSQPERVLVRVFDQTNVLLSGMNWLRWIYLEGRHFDNRPAILARLDEILGRLERLAVAEVAPLIQGKPRKIR